MNLDGILWLLRLTGKNGQKRTPSTCVIVLRLVLASLALVSLAACAGPSETGAFSWKEEVLLHDGSKIIVERSQTYGGSHELGQSSPVKEHTFKFTLPGSSQAVTWVSEYGEDIGRTNFNLLALHILNGTPYIVASPNLILSYNKWGRPNPPYVFFKYDGRAWQRIPLSEFPAEFKAINLIVNNGREEDIGRLMSKRGYVLAEDVSKLNSSLTQSEYRTIQRVPLERWNDRPAGSNSGKMVRTEEGWVGIDWFENQPSNDACKKLCNNMKVSSENCPCNTLFKGK